MRKTPHYKYLIDKVEYVQRFLLGQYQESETCPYSDRLKILTLKLLNGDDLFMIWFLFTRYFMDL